MAALLREMPVDPRKFMIEYLEKKFPEKFQAQEPATSFTPAPRSAPRVVDIPADKVLKVHSAVRWGKTLEQIEAVCAEQGVTLDDALHAADPKNGNKALHISAQNGHVALTEAFLGRGAEVGAQNGKGQTALHMSVEYDFYWQTKLLLESGADRDARNNDGHAAICGIDGGKKDGDAWDAPMNILKSSSTKAQLDFALQRLEAMPDKAALDKAALVQAGMSKKKQCKEAWDAPRFMTLMREVP